MVPPPTDRAGFVGTTAPAFSLSSKSRTITPAAAAANPLPSVRAHAGVSARLATQLVPQPLANQFHNDAAFGKGNGKVIVLFRSDLRLDDHPALSHAIEEAATVVPVYCFDPRHFGRTAHGFEKTGKYRARFLLDSVADLRRSLQNKSSDLIVRTGPPEKILPDLCKKLNCRSVFMHREVTYEDQQVEENLKTALKEKGVDMQMFWANTLYHEDDLPFEIQAMPDMYSEFREQVEKKGTIRTPLPVPESFPRLPPGISAGEIPTLKSLGIDDTPPRTAFSSSGVSSVTGGETEALSRIAAYVSESKRFDAEHSPRSKVTAHLGADFSCRISPWLALGCVSPRRIFEEMKKASNLPNTLLRSSTYLELVWRDFFRFITSKYSSVRSNNKTRITPRHKTMAVS